MQHIDTVFGVQMPFYTTFWDLDESYSCQDVIRDADAHDLSLLSANKVACEEQYTIESSH